MEEERTEEFSRVREIAEAICDGDASDEQKAELHKIIFDNPDAQRFYIEYMDMHARLKANASNDTFELTLRRIEEITLKSGGIANYSTSTTSFGGNNGSTPPLQLEGPQSKPKSILFVVVALIAVTMTGVAIWQLSKKDKPEIFGTVLQGELTETAGNKNISMGSELGAGIYENTNSQQSIIDGNAFKLTLSTSTTVELMNEQQLKLIDGNVEIQTKKPHVKIDLQGTMVESSGKSVFELKTGKSTQTLTVNSGKVYIHPKKWKPTHFWNFNKSTDRVSDLFGGAHGILGKGVKVVEGLSGEKALKFDNSESAHVNLGSGGGTALGTGSFSVTDGVTIEALIKPEWDPTLNKNFDQIFRKDYDGPHRLLLSFQNDHPKNRNYSFPDYGPGPRLAFGLYLGGHKYQELELILDGKDGRPDLEYLKDGKLHHVVATFDSKSGRKAIYIDGKLVCKYDYAPGTRIISGGPGGATIGNNPGTSVEPFTGTIDELAFYNFALTQGEILRHYEFIKNDKNYFGYPSTSSIPSSDQKRKISVEAGQTVTFEVDTGLIIK